MYFFMSTLVALILFVIKYVFVILDCFSFFSNLNLNFFRHAREIQSLASERAELLRQIEKQKFELQNKDAQIAALTSQQERIVNQISLDKNNVVSDKQVIINRFVNF